MWMTAGGKGLPVEVQKQPICTNLHVLTEISTRSTLSYKTLIYTLLERSWTEVARLGSCSARCRLFYKFIEFAIKTIFIQIIIVQNQEIVLIIIDTGSERILVQFTLYFLVTRLFSHLFKFVAILLLKYFVYRRG